jgi:hypothetical protein
MELSPTKELEEFQSTGSKEVTTSDTIHQRLETGNSKVFGMKKVTAKVISIVSLFAETMESEATKEENKKTNTYSNLKNPP